MVSVAPVLGYAAAGTMNRVTAPRLPRLITLAPGVIVGASFLFTLSGCPGGADLEHPELYGIAGSATGTGGTTGGTGATGGTAGAAMSAPFPTVDCGNGLTPQKVLNDDCASTGCHRGNNPPSGLNLTPDDGFIGRTKDVLAKHGDIFCEDILDTCPTPPASCPMTAVLIDSTDWTKSWIIAKLRGAQADCGDQMKDATYLTAKSANEQCLEKLVQTVAMMAK